MRRPLNCVRSLRRHCLRPQLHAPSRLPPWSAHRDGRRTYASEADVPPQSVHASTLKFGQPIHETHPHLIGPGELTRNIPAAEYHDRRTRLAALLPKGSSAIFPSSRLAYRSGLIFHEFHQHPDFLYLTGWCEPNPALAVLESLDGAGDYRWTMFVTPERSPWEQLWNGAVNGVAAARDVWNADEVYSIEEVETVLPKIIESAKPVYATEPAGELLDRLQKKGFKIPVPYDLAPKIADLRVVKSPGEIRNMRHAGRASGRAFNKAMGRKWKTEADLWAYLTWRFRVGGCEKEAYVPVVAGGTNACTVHYTRNDEELREGTLVLVDAAGQYSHYPSDITRTFPVSGTFTPPQHDLYQAVLNIQRHALTLARPGASIPEINRLTRDFSLRELAQLGPRFAATRNVMDTLTPHSISHHIGLDVHDTPTYTCRPLAAGHCITVEPGVYVPEGDERWPREFWGMGVRIEDVVCVEERGEPGPLVLSSEAVKEIVDIEALGRKARDREERRKMRGREGEEDEDEDE